MKKLNKDELKVSSNSLNKGEINVKDGTGITNNAACGVESVNCSITACASQALGCNPSNSCGIICDDKTQICGVSDTCETYANCQTLVCQTNVAECDTENQCDTEKFCVETGDCNTIACAVQSVDSPNCLGPVG